MSSSNDWDVYSLDDSDDRVVEAYIMDYDIEDDWPEYEIPKDDIVLNKEALQAIKLSQPLNSERSNVRQDGEFLKEVESAPQITKLNQTAPEEEKDTIDAMHRKNKGLYNYDEELLSAPHIGPTVQSQRTIGQRLPDNTMTILLIISFIIWLLFQFKVNCPLFMLYCFCIYLPILHRIGGKELVPTNSSR